MTYDFNPFAHFPFFAPHGKDGHHRFGHRHGGRFRGFGPPGDMPGRKLSSADLQLVLLALLEQQPSHGYELIRALTERSGGFYAPSPGVIYPALTYLDEIGHAAAEQDGTRKRYSLTEAGREHLAQNRRTVDAILEALGRIGGRMDQVREAFEGVDDTDGRASDDFHRARHALKQALRDKRGCGPAEVRRIVEVLDRATRDILGH